MSKAPLNHSDRQRPKPDESSGSPDAYKSPTNSRHAEERGTGRRRSKRRIIRPPPGIHRHRLAAFFPAPEDVAPGNRHRLMSDGFTSCLSVGRDEMQKMNEANESRATDRQTHINQHTRPASQCGTLCTCKIYHLEQQYDT